MKFFPKRLDNSPESGAARRNVVLRGLAALGLCGASLVAWQARADLPRWMQDAVSGSAIEAALYRAMQIPQVEVLYPRPPKEAQGELGGLIGKAPNEAELYSLRAMEDEKALDFTAAEKDWKAYVARAKDTAGAKLELADYYRRRLQAADEVSALMEVGSAPASAAEQYTAPGGQRSWKAFERILKLVADQGLVEDTALRAYDAWIARYPRQPSLYARELGWLLDQKKDAERFDRASELIARYRKAFPKDAVFPLKATALLEYRRGSVDRALAAYDSGFQPLWPAELVESYYALLKETHRLRQFTAEARERLQRNPDDLNAAARLFYCAQQQGNLAWAQDVIETYRLSKETRKAAWSAEELYVRASLAEAIRAYPEAAHYEFALYHAQGALTSGASPQAEGLSGMVRILLAAPDQPVELGANNLSLYRDAATLDRGPGYWNGILSLWLNSESPAQAYRDEELRAQPYFHRAKAAELLAKLDRECPKAPQRAELHRESIQVLADYGESALVVKAGKEFLADFAGPDFIGPDFAGPEHEADRVAVAMTMADAYARLGEAGDEFALYDRMLTELGGLTAGMPLTAAAAPGELGTANTVALESPAEADSEDETPAATPKPAAKKLETSRAFEVSPGPPVGVFVSGAQEYRQVLERYLGRLTAARQLPQALAVLRKELDRNPNDPKLYERLADFLEQNNLSAQQEEVYSQAIAKFQERGWYDKLARLYLRERKREAFAELSRKVTDIFSGTELEAYFDQAGGAGPQLYLELNLYAHRRFPHNAAFVEHLLAAYRSKPTYDAAAWERLMREHWSDSDRLRSEFFDWLSSSGKLDAELAELQKLVPGAKERQANPDAARELAEAEMWRSHFEASAPLLGSLAAAYPADEAIGTEASSVFRSLAYYDPAQTERAVEVEKRLLEADPANTDRLARIGDIYADSGADSSASSSAGHENLAAAAPYWRRMPAVHPGTPDGYLQAATVFWDYFQFDDALGEIREARAKFGRPELHGYEAGAIYEGKRDFPAAIAEYTRAAVAADGASEDAAGRLLQLARRKASAAAVDEATAKALASGNTMAALNLRERVLEVEKRGAEIGPLLDGALTGTATLEEARAIGAEAQARSLPAVYERAVERERALAADPVEKIEFSYELARSYEGRKDQADAARVMEAVYRDNPKLLGVVRATADFYWRNKQAAKAIETLTAAAEAAKSAQPALSRQFTAEAADKANQSGQYAEARLLMAPLLAAAGDAYNAEYLAVVADSYARAGDDAGLKQFYLDKLASLKAAGSSMTSDERKEKTALLRRGLIPALTRTKDFAGAVDQYIALLSAYPEDAGTAQEAALYALRNGRQAQLVDFLQTTVKASPRDSRFAILLGQVETALEDYPAAIEAYAHAIAIRSDRQDVYQSKAELEERLQRLDDASKEYERLYVLSYRNPDWMVKIASARARQGRGDEAVQALEKAWIEGHPAAASDYFRVAAQLESWKMLDQSLHFAELGVKAEGDALLAGAEPGSRQGNDDPDGAAIYTRLMTRLRRQDQALAALDAALAAADKSPNSPATVLEQVEKQGLASVTDAEWRKRRAAERRATARGRYRGALSEMGKAVAAYFTPEEKQQFAQLVDARWKTAQHAAGGEPSAWLDVASEAGLLEQEAAMRRQVLLGEAHLGGMQPETQLSAYVELQNSRMAYGELAATLESFIPTQNLNRRSGTRIAQAEAYRHDGDEAAELRTLRKIDLGQMADSGERERYLSLLLHDDVPGFLALAAGSRNDELVLAVPNYAAAHSHVAMARASLRARAARFAPPWETAYSALLGLYFRDVSAVTDGAFHRLLGDQATIAERIATHTNSGPASDAEEDGDSDAAGAADAAQPKLAGRIWFYYGMRYGVYRTLSPKTAWTHQDPEDFLAAGLERNPSAGNYVGLAQAYAEAGETAPAIAEYRHALELAPNAAALHDAIALLQWQTGKKDEAVAEWRAALAALDRIQNKGPAPESFWGGFVQIARHVGSRKLTGQLHPQMDALLRTYLKRNGGYRSAELLQAAYEASATPVEGLDWLLALSATADYPAGVLGQLDSASWLPKGAHEAILLKEIELARIAPAPQAGSAEGSDYPAAQLADLEERLALYYVAQKQDAKAEAILVQLPAARQDDYQLFPAQLELAARGHRMAAFLAAHRDEPEAGGYPNGRFQWMREAAATLSAEGDKADALAIWEFVFGRLQLSHDLMVSDYMGLAKARVESGDAAGAVSLLRRMALLPDEPAPRWGPYGGQASALPADGMANFDRAAELLVETKHDAEAIEFLAALAKGVPWNASYRLRLAQAQLRAGTGKAEALAALAALAGDARESYDLRAEAALATGGLSSSPGLESSNFGSGELRLLAAGKATAQQARQPMFSAARIMASETATGEGERASLLRQAIAIGPVGVTGFRGEDIRRKLFRAEAAAGRGAQALAAVAPLLSEPNSFSGYEPDGENGQPARHDAEGDLGMEDEAADPAAPTSEANPDAGATLSELLRLAPLPQAGNETDAGLLALARLMAQVYRQTGNAAKSLPYLKLAAFLEKDAALKAALDGQIAALETALRLEAANAPRRPQIQRALNQSGAVRPRLVAATAQEAQ